MTLSTKQQERVDALVVCILSDQVPAPDVVRLVEEEPGLKEALRQATQARRAPEAERLLHHAQLRLRVLEAENAGLSRHLANMNGEPFFAADCGELSVQNDIPWRVIWLYKKIRPLLPNFIIRIASASIDKMR